MVILSFLSKVFLATTLSLILLSFYSLTFAGEMLSETDIVEPSTISDSISNENEVPKSPASANIVGVKRLLSSFELWLSAAVLVFGLIVLLIQYSLLKKQNFSPESLLKNTAVTLIIVATLFVVTAGFDGEQIAPAMGLFGTIAGYLLGSQKSKNDSTN